jgi:outer membrane protein assembly factor BamD (BamD/ComL family)
VLLTCFSAGFSQSLKKGFEALKVYNYFYAKKSFEKNFKRKPIPSSYGLSIILSRNDNPFFDIEIAYAYILNANRLYDSSEIKKRLKLQKKFNINSASIELQRLRIDSITFQIIRENPTISSLERFMEFHPDAKQIPSAIELRNKLAFEQAIRENDIESFKEFLEKYPDANEFNEIKALYEKSLFQRYANLNSTQGYDSFIVRHPESPYIRNAKDSIYKILTYKRTVSGYDEFLRRYPDNPNADEAWTNLYNLFTKDLSTESFKQFIQKYPDCPFIDKARWELILCGIEFIPYRENGLWGFIDLNGNEFIEANFDWVGEFSYGLAPFLLDNKYGYLRKNGTIQIHAHYDDVMPFSSNYAIVEKEGYYGIIDKAGNIIFDLIYDDIESPVNEIFPVCRNEKYGFIKQQKDSLKLIFDFTYEYADNFYDSLSRVKIRGKYGFINLKNEFVIQPRFDYAEVFKDGKSIVKINDSFGIISLADTFILKPEYTAIGEYNDSLILIAQGYKYGFADDSGRIRIPIIYDYNNESIRKSYFINKLALVRKKTKYGIIDNMNEIVIPFKYTELKYDGGEIIPAKLKNWGFISLENKNISRFIYDETYNFSEGLAKIKLDDLYGFIDSSGNMTIENKYQQASDFKNGISLIKRNNKYGILDINGFEITFPVFDKVIVQDDDLLLFYINGKFAYWSISLKKCIWKEEGFQDAYDGRVLQIESMDE